MIREERLYTHDTPTQQETNIALLKKHFPNCFDKNGAFMPHKMAEVIGENELNLSKESYALNWLGKAYARVLAHDKPLTFLKADEVHNQHEANQNSENILIKGDNLEVLKHLRNAYAEQIKMIYIDPPYNTGSDGFVYNDDRKFTPEQLMRLAGIELEEAKRILDFTRSKANSHSAWLTFMYPRLYIARELLREDGVIFISIDDNEQAQLKLLCDDVFGEENFVANIIWNRKRGRDNSARWFSKSHEYLLVYAKNKELFETNYLDLEETTKKAYKNPDNDKRGDYRMLAVWARGTQGGVKYDFVNKEGQYFSERLWLFSKKSLTDLDSEDRLITKGDNLYRKLFIHENKGKIPETIWDHVSNAANASDEIKSLFGKIVFDTPKPIPYIQEILKIGSSNSDDLILDFFAGSGTTAHAVMDLNAKDGGKRKYICVQLPESTDAKSEAHKAGYKTIFDITKARIEKAANHIRTTPSLLSHEIDLGFKIFETEPLFEGYDEEQETLEATTTLFDGSKLNAEALQTLLCTWKLYDGLSLTTPTQNVVLAGYNAYQAGKNLYVMHPGFDINAIKALIANLDDEADFNASKIVLFGYNVTSKTQRELFEALQSYTNKKSIELDVVVRY